VAKTVGDKIEEGDILAEMKRGQSTQWNFESFNEGIFIIYWELKEGDSAPVDTLLAIIGEKRRGYFRIVEQFPSSDAKRTTRGTCACHPLKRRWPQAKK